MPICQLLIYRVTNHPFDTPSERVKYGHSAVKHQELVWYYGIPQLFGRWRRSRIFRFACKPEGASRAAYAQALINAGVSVDFRNFVELLTNFSAWARCSTKPSRQINQAASPATVAAAARPSPPRSWSQV
jgi:hypothetical protein